MKKLLDKATFIVHWPGLHLYTAKGAPSSLPNFTLNLLTTPGTQMLVAGVLTMVALRLSVGRALRAYGGDAASAAMGDRHRNGGAGTGIRDERVGADHHPGHVDGRGRRRRSR